MYKLTLSSPPFQGGVGVVAEVMTKIFNRHNSKDIRKELRNNLTKGEVILWQHLKGSQLGGFKFRRQQSVQDFIVDFYCPEIKLAVEVDGQTHEVEEVFARDQWRQKIIEKENIIFKRYTSNDIFNNLNQALDDLYQTCLGLRQRNLGNHPRP